MAWFPRLSWISGIERVGQSRLVDGCMDCLVHLVYLFHSSKKQEVEMKKTESQMFKELRINTLIVGIAMIIIFLVTTFIFKEALETTFYQGMFVILGVLLISYSLQKYFQKNPKIRNIALVILTILVLLALILFLIMI